MTSLPHGKKYLVGGVTAALIGTVFLFPPIAQDLAYHDFADKRPLAQVPNAGDVLSNIPFCIVGLWGLLMLWRQRGGDTAARLLWHVFFFGVFLVGFGSGYYHWAPDNQTLVWDRLPMTIAFMSLFSLVIAERIRPSLGYALFPLLLAAGAGSVWYWAYTESIGAGDLRPYALVQFLPMVLILLMRHRDVALFQPAAIYPENGFGRFRWLMINLAPRPGSETQQASRWRQVFFGLKTLTFFLIIVVIIETIFA